MREFGLLIQTNKKGFGIAAWNTGSFDPRIQQALSSWAKNKLSSEIFEANDSESKAFSERIFIANFTSGSNTCEVFVVVSKVQTAEGLSNAVQELLQKMNMKLQSLGTLVFASGPGSFTGLRLGCSFCAGVSLAFSDMFSNLNNVEHSNVRMSQNFQPLQKFQVLCETLETIRYSQTYVEMRDVLQSIARFGVDSEFFEVEHFSPEYGNQPGPVKLLNLGVKFT